VTQITGLDALEATAKRADRIGSARVEAGFPKPVLDDQYLRGEILALSRGDDDYARTRQIFNGAVQNRPFLASWRADDASLSSQSGHSLLSFASTFRQ
jgi:hypothetical protein